ncbi:hypothetical protein EL26_15280 [Tumebacillus flagellatus]|uniref:Uncharacterized protein n=1 Tax=Tumebacillus flagellatus TaxID=1157490 RepID=A0A074LMS9_9BACL|nr:hypothetical protein EL26_15280 [Tumebacillus flagellatus]
MEFPASKIMQVMEFIIFMKSTTEAVLTMILKYSTLLAQIRESLTPTDSTMMAKEILLEQKMELKSAVTLHSKVLVSPSPRNLTVQTSGQLLTREVRPALLSSTAFAISSTEPPITLQACSG